MADDPHSIVAEVDAQFEKLANATYYELLGVSEDTPDTEIRKRFRELAKRYHADRYAGLNLPSEVRAKMTRLLSQISRAHSVLTNAEKRKDYDATLAMQAAGVPTDLGTIVEAENLFRNGCKLMDKGTYAAALGRFNEACKLNPAEPEFAATAAYCKYWTLPRDEKERVKDRRAVKLIVDHLSNYLTENPKSDQVAVFLALLAKAEGNTDHAVGYFREALAINPNNIMAARELRLYRMRKEKGGGLFKRLFSMFDKKQ